MDETPVTSGMVSATAIDAVGEKNNHYAIHRP